MTAELKLNPALSTISVTPPATQPPRVTIGVPALGTHKSVMSVSLAALAAHSITSGVAINIMGHDLSGIARNRNIIAQTAKDMGSTHVLMIDSDMAFPPDLLLKLLSHDKDIVGVPYPRRSPPYELLGRPKRPELNDQHGLVEMALLPAGLLLIKLSVFDVISMPWFFESSEYFGDNTRQIREVLFDTFPQPLAEQLARVCMEFPEDEVSMLSQPDKPTQTRSEDLNFILKAQRYGFRVWGDLDLLRVIGHIGEQIVRVGDATQGVAKCT